jgi:hypothetical protein
MTGVFIGLFELARWTPAQSRINARQPVIAHFTSRGRDGCSMGDDLVPTGTEAHLGWEEGRREIPEYGRRLLCGKLNWKRSSRSDVQKTDSFI